MKKYNDLFAEALISHQIGLFQQSNRIRNKVLKILEDTEKKLADAIVARLATHQSFRAASDKRRLARLKKVIEELRGAAWDEIAVVWQEEVRQLAVAEPKFFRMIFESVVPILAEVQVPPISIIDSILRTQPFEGRTLPEWAKHQKRTDLDNILKHIKLGMIQGETASEISRRIVGTSRLPGSGVTGLSRRQMQGLILTSVNFINNSVRRELHELNEEYFKEELFVATLDGRTSAICRKNDGKIFPVGEGPIPPLHFRCRSLRVAVLDGEVLGERPFVATTERQILRDYAQANGLGRNIRVRSELPRGHKGTYDAFRLSAIRSATGRLPARTSYEDFLRNQSVEFQNAVLGKTKAILFRKGDLSLDKFVNRLSKELTLEELAKLHAANFIKAGLNPKNYIS